MLGTLWLMGEERHRFIPWGGSPHHEDIYSCQLASVTVPAIHVAPLASQFLIELLFYSWRKYVLTGLDQPQACFWGGVSKAPGVEGPIKSLVFFKFLHMREREGLNLGIHYYVDGTMTRAVLNYIAMFSPPAPNYTHVHFININPLRLKFSNFLEVIFTLSVAPRPQIGFNCLPCLGL